MLKKHVQSLIQPMVRQGVMTLPLAFTNGLLGITTGAELAAAMGFATAPNWMGKGNEASGMSDLVGSNNLSGAGTPAYQVVSPDFNDLTVEMDAASTDGLIAASNSVNDPSTGSFASLWVGELMYQHGFNNHALHGKKQSGGGDYGWNLVTNGINAGDYKFRVDAKTVANDKPHTVTHSTYLLGPQVFLFVHDVTGKASALHSLEATASQTWFTNGDIFSFQNYRIGDGLQTAANARHGLVAYWEGAPAEGLNATHVANLKTYLGI